MGVRVAVAVGVCVGTRVAVGVWVIVGVCVMVGVAVGEPARAMRLPSREVRRRSSSAADTAKPMLSTGRPRVGLVDFGGGYADDFAVAID